MGQVGREVRDRRLRLKSKEENKRIPRACYCPVMPAQFSRPEFTMLEGEKGGAKGRSSAGKWAELDTE